MKFVRKIVGIFLGGSWEPPARGGNYLRHIVTLCLPVWNWVRTLKINAPVCYGSGFSDPYSKAMDLNSGSYVGQQVQNASHYFFINVDVTYTNSIRYLDVGTVYFGRFLTSFGQSHNFVKKKLERFWKFSAHCLSKNKKCNCWKKK